ncbi:glycerol kinase [Sphingobacterium mizutaii NBRC 14946 = DSM 11724]|uniref:Glycerol kinase n=2 Tax=Sphingobacterium mizutaii TaxID=1010 RepID=A0AAJ4XCG2_9SPHI|nr:glycerol kinase GlpK [Sphingobacterium mizutaii]GEM69313.1 glycerol kinase [Sphingobacterium mizutaii NBRC 14946 = DSM 11724]SDL13174.1 glycerol kinase [Sphingobacterium mizutaii]SNV51887.1 Glycerol kinase [Sphingobacterium mizutaii]
MKEYIVALDQGTTSSRAILFNKKGDIVNIAQKEFQQIYPKSGWVEHDPQEIWSSQMAVFTEALAKSKTKLESIKGIGITNQRETTVVWNRRTGEPIYNAIVWQDRRTADYCAKLIQDGHLDMVQEKTGLLIDSYFSATKIKWILDNVKGARKLAERKELAFGTIDSWLIWNLTNGEKHVTDVTNASRTMLYNINELKWDKELLELFDIPESLLPEVKSSSEVYGETSTELGSRPIPIAGIAGDQQAALFGQMCIKKGMAKNTYGTGCFLLMNIGNKPVKSENKLVTTIGWKIGKEVVYALEGSIFIGGAVVQWLRDELKIIKKSSDVEALASSVDTTDGVYLVPAFAGLGAPHWNPNARGTIFGISRGTTDAHIARAAIESIAYQTHDILKAMEADSKTKIKELRVDGGATQNQFLLQFQADILKSTVVRPKITETTAMGAAFLAGLAVGFWKDLAELQELWQEDKRIENNKSAKLDKNLEEWNRAVNAVIYWSNNA